MDLERYLQRVGYNGSLEPTLDTLHRLTAAQAQSIPFENIDVLLGRPIRLEPDALYRKLVLDHRGGYCFEQNGLLMEVLWRLGFQVRPLSARVRLGTPDRQVVVARSHLVLEVQVDDRCWITDVGVGSASLTCALRLVADQEQSTPHDVRRLQYQGDRWYHQVRRSGAWVDVYEFTGEAMPWIDRVMANWYTSTHPDSSFRRELKVAIARADGGRETLHNHELVRRERDGSAHVSDISDPDRLLDVLRERFGIDLPAGMRFALGERTAHSSM